MHVKVSVVVPIYNTEKYLEQCLQSIVSQTLKDLEIICVNDGSTDNSLQIIERFANEDDRIKIISKENTGYGDSMNIGLKRASGEYIGIVESDDFIENDMYEKLYLCAKNNDLDIVKSNFYKYSDKQGKQKHNCDETIVYDEVINPLERGFGKMEEMSHWSCLYKHSFIAQNNICFLPTKGASFQDCSFMFIAFLYAKRVMFLKEAYLYYRIDNINSSVKSKEKVFAIFGEYERIWQVYEKEEKTETLLKICPIKYMHYFGHYWRVDSIFQYSFLMKLSDSLKLDNKKNYLDKKYWDSKLWDEISLVMNDADAFFRSTNIDYINKYVINKYTVNNSMKREAFWEYLSKQDKIYVYGAGIYAKSVYDIIRKNNHVYAFVVSNLEENEHSIEGVPVINIDSVEIDAFIIVAVLKRKQIEIVNELHNKGYKNIYAVNDKFLDEI